jgi:hypothetical protein
MATFNVTSEAETILGKLTNGRKLVMKEVVISDAGIGQTTITVKSLEHIIAYTVGLAVPLVVTFAVVDGAATAPNTIKITPSGDATGCTLQIIAVGE